MCMSTVRLSQLLGVLAACVDMPTAVCARIGTVPIQASGWAMDARIRRQGWERFPHFRSRGGVSEPLVAIGSALMVLARMAKKLCGPKPASKGPENFVWGLWQGDPTFFPPWACTQNGQIFVEPSTMDAKHEGNL